jgi:uncharacterized protein YcfL
MKLSALALALALGLGCSHGAATDQQAKAGDSQAKIANVGSKAPNGSLAQASGTKVALNDVLREHAQNVVVFYRGFY